MAHQRAITATRLGECADAAQMRNQRQHRRERRWVEIARFALEGRPLAHFQAACCIFIGILLRADRSGGPDGSNHFAETRAKYPQLGHSHRRKHLAAANRAKDGLRPPPEHRCARGRDLRNNLERYEITLAVAGEDLLRGGYFVAFFFRGAEFVHGPDALGFFVFS